MWKEWLLSSKSSPKFVQRRKRVIRNCWNCHLKRKKTKTCPNRQDNTDFLHRNTLKFEKSSNYDIWFYQEFIHFKDIIFNFKPHPHKFLRNAHSLLFGTLPIMMITGCKFLSNSELIMLISISTGLNLRSQVLAMLLNNCISVNKPLKTLFWHPPKISYGCKYNLISDKFAKIYFEVVLIAVFWDKPLNFRTSFHPDSKHQPW